MDLARQLCVPNGPYSKSQVARALSISRDALYEHSKQAHTHKQEEMAVEQLHELDDIQEHCKTEAIMTNSVFPRPAVPEKRSFAMPALPWRLLILISFLLTIGIPAFLFGTRVGQRVLPTLTNYFYNSSGTPPPTPTPLPSFPVTVPQPGSLLYSIYLVIADLRLCSSPKLVRAAIMSASPGCAASAFSSSAIAASARPAECRATP